MSQPPRPTRPAAPSPHDPAADATGLNSFPIDADVVDDLASLAASITPQPLSRLKPSVDPPIRRPRRGTVRKTFIPLLLTGGLICLGLAVAWWMTDGDSPYRRVSVALPVVLTITGAVLLLAAAANIAIAARDARADVESRV